MSNKWHRNSSKGLRGKKLEALAGKVIFGVEVKAGKTQYYEAYMKNLRIIFALTILLTGGAIGAMTSPSQAQVYAPPPTRPLVTPWAGPNTPWVFYNGDWFLNGTLYYFFGPKHGWAPYYAYAPVYVVRPTYWYAPKWNAWYREHPMYWGNFHRKYPHWRGHNIGHRYDEAFYNRYHHGPNGGWHRGFHGQS